VPKSKPKQFYVYVYRDPRPGKRRQPFYVGKGCGRRSHRPPELRKNALLTNVIAKLLAVQLEPIIEIVARFKNETSAFAAEKRLIKRYGRRDIGTGPLCNMTDGGERTSGCQWMADQVKNNTTFLKRLKAKVRHRYRVLANDPTWVQKRSTLSKQLWLSPKFRKNGEATLKRARASQAFRDGLARREFSLTERKRRAEHLRQQIRHNTQFLTRSLATRRQLWADPNYRPDLRTAWSDRFKRFHDNPQFERNRLRALRSAKVRKKISQAIRRLWTDPKYRSYQAARRRRPKQR
jgi:hypothetical protein